MCEGRGNFGFVEGEDKFKMYVQYGLEKGLRGRFVLVTGILEGRIFYLNHIHR